ncbi:MAG: NADP oxidoreductase, partial [Gammaproteobacteria bacterium]|nr:NADP oxidoreductase [Gammaproteobacteria bacterium]
AMLAEKLSLSETEIHDVISFYSFLHSNKNIKYNLLISNNITDRMQGNAVIFEAFERNLGENEDVLLQMTSCIGMCDQGPAMMVNGRTITSLDDARTSQVCELIRQQQPVEQWPNELFSVADNICKKGLLLDDNFPSGAILKKLIERGADQCLAEIEASGLRGRGGAGFPTANKWRFCQQTESDQRYVICNADEGEPGTFKDRVLLNRYAATLIEGMTLCAGIIGASKGYIYLRGEYLFLKNKLAEILQQQRDTGLLGNDILGQHGFDFDIEIHMGAGAYICGEESALIESMEGKPGIPRIRPPFPVNAGYRNKPTVVNNVETFIAAANIAQHGADWFTQTGTDKSTGTKILSISGDCELPGIYEYPFGTSIRQILNDCKARNTQAVQIAGAAGHLVAEKDFEHTIGFDDFATGGSFMIFDHSRDLFEVIQNFTSFFKHESCGFCTPCRVGTALQHDLADKLAKGHATAYDLNELRTIGKLMRTSSHCGLGATASTAVIDLLDNFPQLVEQQLAHTDYEPSFDLDAALQQARDITHRNDDSAHIGERS